MSYKQEGWLAELLALEEDETARRRFLAGRKWGLAEIEALKGEVERLWLSDPQAARRVAEVTMEVASFCSHPLARALAGWAKGNALLYLGEYEECLALYGEAQAAYAAQEMALEVGRLATNRVFVLTNLGRYDEARQAAEAARAALERCEQAGADVRRFRATLEMNAGVLARVSGRYHEALVAYERGRALFLEIDDPVQAARMDVNRAKVLEDLDRFRQALALLEAAGPVFIEHGQRLPAARTDFNRGHILLRTGRYREALAAYERARAGFAALENEMELAAADYYRSRVYLALNLWPEALELAEAAAEQFRARGMQRQLAQVLAAQAAAQAGLGEPATALRLLDRARTIFAEREAGIEAARLDLQRAALRLAEGDPRRALWAAQDAAGEFERAGLPIHLTQARLLMGECHLALGSVAEARLFFREGLARAQEAGIRPLIYRGEHGLGRVEEARGRSGAAYEHYRAAIEHIEALRDDLLIDEFQAAFLDDKLAVYEDAVRLALARDQVAAAFEWIGRARSGVLLDALARTLEPDPQAEELLARLAGLREEWHWLTGRAGEGETGRWGEGETGRGGEGEAVRGVERRMAEVWRELRLRQIPDVPLSRPAAPSLSQVQQGLDDDALLVAYFAVKGRLLAFLVGRGATEVVELASLPEVETLLARWRFSLGTPRLLPPAEARAALPALCADARTHLGRLYRALAAPFADRLRPCRKLHIVPHGPLHDVPFAALWDGSHYWLERFEIALLPGVSGYGGCTKDVRRMSEGRPALVMGYSDRGRVPLVVEEARAVAEQISKGAEAEVLLFVEEQATAGRLWEHGPGCGVIHLATHARFRADNPLFSALRLADGWLLLGDLYRLRLSRAGLVTSSGCETGLGEPRGGALLGLARAFRQAGAGTLVVSLWRVDDAATAGSMAAFYRELMAGKAEAAALRAAQLEALERYRHPFYWGAFVVVDSPCRISVMT